MPLLAKAACSFCAAPATDGARDRPAFGLVAVEQQIAVASAAQHGGELPAEIDRVLDAGVHALAAGRAVDVGGIAGEKHAAVSIADGQPLVDAEGGEPARAVQPQARRAVTVHVALQFVDGAGRVVLVVLAHGEDAPGRFLERKHRDGAAAVPPDVDALMVEIAVDLDVAEQVGLRLGVAFEFDAERAAHEAAGAIGADHVHGAQRLGAAVMGAQLGGDAAVVLFEADEFDAAFHCQAEFGGTRRENGFGDALRQQQRVGVGAVDAVADLERGQLPFAVADPQRVQAGAGGDELVDDAEPGECFEAAAPDGERLRDGGRHRGAVDQAHRNAVAAQGDGQRQAGRAGAADQNGQVGGGSHRIPMENGRKDITRRVAAAGAPGSRGAETRKTKIVFLVSIVKRYFCPTFSEEKIHFCP